MTAPYAFVFDLDDTLYPEREFVSSCFVWFANAVGDAAAKSTLEASFEAGDKDPIGSLCTDREIDNAEKKRLVAEMRAHSPDISLASDAGRLLERLRIEGRGFSIITNGRSVTQRRKLEALGLLDAHTITISEEVGAEKPDPAIYAPAVEAYPNARCIYVGDNPRKDFITPNKLGWLSVMRRHDGRGIHAQDADVPASWRAKRSVGSLDELVDLLVE